MKQTNDQKLHPLDIYRLASFTERQDFIFKSCMKVTSNYQAFECGGLVFKGNRRYAAIEFAKDNPEGGDFFVWLQDHYTLIGQKTT